MPPVDIGTISIATLAAAATGSGAIVWAAMLNWVIGTFKQAIPGLIEGREKLWAFLLAGVFEVIAFFLALSLVPPTLALDVFGLFVGFLSWLGLARLTMSSYDDFATKKVAGKQTRKKESVFSPVGWAGKPTGGG
jgi:hypothetical protein